MSYVVYELLNKKGSPYYVGFTGDVRRRMKEHGTRLRGRVTYAILEHFADELAARAAEIIWIQRRLSEGFRLQNRMVEVSPRATLSHGADTRALLSAAGRGKPKPEGFGAKLSAKTKGRPHAISEAAAARMAPTQFRPGEGRFSDLPLARQQRLRESRTRQWDSVPPAERSAQATARNLAAWAKRTPEQRAEIGRRIAAAKRAQRYAP